MNKQAYINFTQPPTVILQNKVIIQQIDASNVHSYININIFANIIYNNFSNLCTEPYLVHSHESIIELLTNSNLHGWLILYGNTLLGYLLGETKTLYNGRYGYFLDYVYISKKYRSKHLGNVLMNRLIKYCREIEIIYITLICDFEDTRVMNFYKKYGFVKDKNLDNKQKHNVMCLCLKY